MSNIIPKTWHPSWDAFMTEDIITELKQINEKIGTDYVPEEKNVLRFLQRDLTQIKCVWIGQDPYYTMYDTNKYVANGAAFWPNDLHKWTQPFSQRSLQNIVRLIYKDYNNITEYKEIKKFNEIKQEIEIKKFPMLQPQEWFASLEEQGVLLLNIYLTTNKGKGNCHKKIWESFSQKLLKYISSANEEIHWFLWGGEAQSQEMFISKGNIYKSNHPTFCSEKYENDFLKNDCFKNTMEIIDWRGKC